MSTVSSFSAFEFQAHQIVRLQHESTYLYAEVIQVVSARRLCWARPLVLLLPKMPESTFLTPTPRLMDAEFDAYTFLDLRQGSDLLLPLSWFEAAIDVEVIPILAQLDIPKDPADSGNTLLNPVSAHRQMQQFIQQLCHTRSDAP